MSSQQGHKNGANSVASSGGRPKKSKLEKIAELEAALKIAKEENRRLKNQVQSGGKSGSASAPSSPGGALGAGFTSDGAPARKEDVDKMKDAVKALKRVTINQEMSLQSLRAKASQRRNELEARDVTIAKLHRQIAALRRQDGGGGGGGGGADLRKLTDALTDEQNRNVELQELLEATEAKVETLERQLAASRKQGNNTPFPLFQRENSLTSMKSTDVASVSTSASQEFDIAKLKKELAKKSNRIVELEYQLELTREKLHEMTGKFKQQRRLSGFEADFGTTDNPFGEDAFAGMNSGSGGGGSQQNHFASPGGKSEEDFYSDEEDNDWF